VDSVGIVIRRRKIEAYHSVTLVDDPMGHGFGKDRMVVEVIHRSESFAPACPEQKDIGAGGEFIRNMGRLYQPLVSHIDKAGRVDPIRGKVLDAMAFGDEMGGSVQVRSCMENGIPCREGISRGWDIGQSFHRNGRIPWKGWGRLIQDVGEVDHVTEMEGRVRSHKKGAARKDCPKGIAFYRNYFAATASSRTVM